MTYEIRDNPQFGSKEIYFDGKPSEAVRGALKGLKFRWYPAKKCWYGYADESALISAILGTNADDTPAEAAAVIVTDGYMGGGAVYGSKSHKALYGSDLSAAIRADIKAAGLKGVTIATRHGNITATIRTTPGDVKTLDEFMASYQITPAFGWIRYDDDEGICRDIHITEYYNLTDDQQEKIRLSAAKLDYHQEVEKEMNVCHYHLDQYHGFTAAGLEKIKKVLAIISAYRYDESNAMVDYFDTNFYFWIRTKPEKKAA